MLGTELPVHGFQAYGVELAFTLLLACCFESDQDYTSLAVGPEPAMESPSLPAFENKLQSGVEAVQLR